VGRHPRKTFLWPFQRRASELRKLRFIAVIEEITAVSSEKTGYQIGFLFARVGDD
jgi:hypothetical protein